MWRWTHAAGQSPSAALRKKKKREISLEKKMIWTRVSVCSPQFVFICFSHITPANQQPASPLPVFRGSALQEAAWAEDVHVHSPGMRPVRPTCTWKINRWVVKWMWSFTASCDTEPERKVHRKSAKTQKHTPSHVESWMRSAERKVFLTAGERWRSAASVCCSSHRADYTLMISLLTFVFSNTRRKRSTWFRRCYNWTNCDSLRSQIKSVHMVRYQQQECVLLLTAVRPHLRHQTTWHHTTKGGRAGVAMTDKVFYNRGN